MHGSHHQYPPFVALFVFDFQCELNVPAYKVVC